MLQFIHREHDTHLEPLSGTQSGFSAAVFENDGKHHLLLASSGSVATIKLPNILSALSHHPNLSIRVILTKSATNFLAGQSAEQPHIDTLHSIPNVDGVFLDEEEWIHPWKRGNAILHIELRRWAHMLVIAPLSANTLAKIVGGFSDNLLTSVVRAWDTTGLLSLPASSTVAPGSSSQTQVHQPLTHGRKRIIVAPAMNTAMWRHPITKTQIRVLEEDWGVGDERAGIRAGNSIAGDGDFEDEGREGWFEVLKPVEKELACGDVGDGAMRDWKEIVQIIEQRFGL